MTIYLEEIETLKFAFAPMRSVPWQLQHQWLLHLFVANQVVQDAREKEDAKMFTSKFIRVMTFSVCVLCSATWVAMMTKLFSSTPGGHWEKSG